MLLYTTNQMRAVEAAAIAAGAVSGRELMERAGAAVAAEIARLVPDSRSTPRRAVVLCGPGGNGGDGYVVARLLAQAGWRVAALGLGDPAKAPPDAADARRGWEALGPVRPLADLPLVGPGAHVIVDALFGGGLTRPLPAEVGAAFDALFDAEIEAGENDCDLDESAWSDAFPTQWRVAVDAPSGLCLDTGRTRGYALRAGVTITFHAPKVGHYVEKGPDLCGRLLVADIGLEGFTPDFSQPTLRRRIDLTEAPTLAAVKARGAHKYDHGHVLVLAGGAGRGGAARLAARGALRIGAGLVTVGAPPEAMAENAARLDAIMLRCVAGPQALSDLLGEGRVRALVMGPGLGVGPATMALLEAALAPEHRAVSLVLDADALTTLAQNEHGRIDDINSWFALRSGARVVLTPHMGEFKRLFSGFEDGWGPESYARLFGKVAAVEQVAQMSGCTVLLKGPDTVVGSTGDTVSVSAAVYDRAAPWLATAGSGDVLAGMIGGLLARGWRPREAAADAAWLHQEAGRALGPGLIAEDIPEALPRVLRRLARRPARGPVTTSPAPLGAGRPVG